MTSTYIPGLMIGTAIIAFGLGHANGARGRTMFPAAWIDGAVLAFIGANVLVFTYFGLQP